MSKNADILGAWSRSYDLLAMLTAEQLSARGEAVPNAFVLRAMPFVPVAAAFAGGLGGAAWFHPPLPTLWIIAVALALGSAWLLRQRREGPAALLVLLAVGNLGAQWLREPPIPADHLARRALPVPVRLEGVLVAEPSRWAPGRSRLLIEAETIYEGTDRRSARGTVLVTVHGEPPILTQGQRIAGEFRLHRPQGFRNPDGFDYPQYLARDGIFLVGSGRADRLTPLTPEAPPWPIRIRRWALGAIHLHLPPVSATLLAGLLLGERTELPRTAHEAFRRAGVYHILAVSGFNVALLASAVFLGLSLLRIPRRLVAVAAVGLQIGRAHV